MPKMKFTAVSIKNLKPQPKSIEYFDIGREHGAGSLGLRVSPKNKRTWFLMYTVGGKVKRYTMGYYPSMTLKAARDEAINAMAKVNDGNDPQQKKQDSKRAETFAELWEYYLTAPGLGKRIKRFTDKAESTKREDRRKYERHLKGPLGHIKLVDITRGEIKQVLESLSDKKHSANRLYALLSVLFKHADDKEWITSNPLPPSFGEPEEPRDRYLSVQEIKTIWPELTGQIGAIYKIILLTGQRPGQVGGMRWGEIEDDTWIIPKERVKSRKSQQVVPLSAQVIEILESLKNESDFVFQASTTRGHVELTWDYRVKLQKKTEVHGFTAHDLRRTARTLLGKLQIKPHIAELVIGHSQQGIVKVYDLYSYLPEKRIALDMLANEIDRIVTGGKPAKVVEMRKQA